jgi:hypothetical protein
MVAQLMTGASNGPDNLWVLLSPPSNDEERRVCSKLMENLEDTRCVERVGTIVKGRCHGRLIIGTALDRPPTAGSEQIGSDSIQHRPRDNPTEQD